MKAAILPMEKHGYIVYCACFPSPFNPWVTHIHHLAQVWLTTMLVTCSSRFICFILSVGSCVCWTSWWPVGFVFSCFFLMEMALVIALGCCHNFSFPWDSTLSVKQLMLLWGGFFFGGGAPWEWLQKKRHLQPRISFFDSKKSAFASFLAEIPQRNLRDQYNRSCWVTP